LGNVYRIKKNKVKRKYFASKNGNILKMVNYQANNMSWLQR